MNKYLLAAAGLTLCLSACRGDNDDTNTADSGISAADGTPGSSNTIYDVQNDGTPVGSSVTLRSVVVTALDTFGNRTGGIYVQEADGGPYSGVLVFGASTSGLAVGDLVDVDNGVKTEFSFDFVDGHSITQVTSPDGGAVSVTKKGTGTVPAPAILNSWDLAASDEEAEKWEGVLVRFDGMRVLRSADGVSTSDMTLKEMTVTGPFRVGGSLADLTGVRDDCYASITGIGDYFFSYKILPRSPADIVADATGDSCLPPEATKALCEDKMDNDHDGFSDCSDFSCQENVPDDCTIDTTVVEAQNGSVAENSLIRLTDVVVTAVSADNKKFWVQDEVDTAVPFNGLYVFRGSTQDDLPSNIIGKKVTLLGNLDEFHGQLTELTNVAETYQFTGNGTITTLTGVSLADLSTMKDYEGVLVELGGDTEVITSRACNEAEAFCHFSVGSVGSPLQANELIFDHEATAGQCFSPLTGIMHYDDFDTTNDDMDNPPGIVILPLEANTAGVCQ